MHLRYFSFTLAIGLLIATVVTFLNTQPTDAQTMPQLDVPTALHTDTGLIAFIPRGESGEEQRDLFVSSPDGSQTCRLTSGREIWGNINWSPDGQWIAYSDVSTNPTTHHLVRYDGSERLDLPTDFTMPPTFSGDSSEFVSQDLAYRFAIDGTALPVPDLPPANVVIVYDWQANSEWLVIVADSDNTFTPRWFSIETGETRPFTPRWLGSAPREWDIFSPDGVYNITTNRDYNEISVRIDDETQYTISTDVLFDSYEGTEDFVNPSLYTSRWSPDNQQILLRDSFNDLIIVTEIDGSNPRHYINRNVGSFRWLNNRYLTFSDSIENQTRILDTQTDDSIMRTIDALATTNGERVVVAGQPPSAGIDFSCANILPEPTPVPEGHLSLVLNTTDGTAIPLNTDAGLVAYRLSNQSSDLYVMDTRTGDVCQLTNGINALFSRWSPDGQWILFWENSQSTESKAIVRYDGSDIQYLPTDFTYSGVFSPDSTEIVDRDLRHRIRIADGTRLPIPSLPMYNAISVYQWLPDNWLSIAGINNGIAEYMLFNIETGVTRQWADTARDTQFRYATDDGQYHMAFIGEEIGERAVHVYEGDTLIHDISLANVKTSLGWAEILNLNLLYGRFSPDNSQIMLFGTIYPHQNPDSVIIMNIDGSNPRRYTEDVMASIRWVNNDTIVLAQDVPRFRPDRVYDRLLIDSNSMQPIGTIEGNQRERMFTAWQPYNTRTDFACTTNYPGTTRQVARPQPTPSPTLMPTATTPSSTTAQGNDYQTCVSGWYFGTLTPNPIPEDARFRCSPYRLETSEYAYQPYERGFMLWHSNFIYAVSNDTDGDNLVTVIALYDEWDGTPVAINDAPPAGLVAPQRGFGFVWQNTPEIRALLGWATDAETGYTAQSQQMTYYTATVETGGTLSLLALPEERYFLPYLSDVQINHPADVQTDNVFPVVGAIVTGTPNETIASVPTLAGVPATSVPQATPTPFTIVDSCQTGLPTQLAVGMVGRVTLSDPGETPVPLRVRETAGGAYIESMAEGTTFTVIGGPTCVDGFTWWELETTEGTLTGWSAEGLPPDDYFMEPNP